ncbi:hypothetical protein HanRHA438_Chr12g0570521 [Helianthus annuus]|nr:hypothetical protein HanRHA438_Chr12g0570521 [Helianthus annuus]
MRKNKNEYRFTLDITESCCIGCNTIYFRIILLGCKMCTCVVTGQSYSFPCRA